jgi:hypothetical protein
MVIYVAAIYDLHIFGVLPTISIAFRTCIYVTCGNVFIKIHNQVYIMYIEYNV